MSEERKTQSGPADTGSQNPSSGWPIPSEPAEPSVQKGGVPAWLIALLVALLYWGDMYVMDHGADVVGKAGPFPALVYDPFRAYQQLVDANPVDPSKKCFLDGQKTYNLNCVVCHQSTGLGVAGQFPPLAGSEWVTSEGAARIIRAVLNGLSGPIDVKGQSFNNAMLSWKPNLNDEQIACVLTYVRSEWGNKAPPVSPEEVAKLRKELEGRDEPMTAAELLKLPEKAP